MKGLGSAGLATLLVLSLVAPVALTGTASAAPQGFVTVADDQISEDLPSDYSGDLRATDLRGRTLANRSASTLDVIVTTPGRAESYVDGNTLGGAGDAALVLRDDNSSEGRQIALDAEAMRAAFGYLPGRVFGRSDNGDQWSSSTRVEDGYLIFEVPHFSTNTVTFSSDVSITADPAVDGSTYSYQLDSPSSTSNATVNLTGVETTETDTVTKTGIASAGTVDLGIAGNDPATGVDLTFIGEESTTSASSSGTGTGSVSVGGNVDPTGEAVTFTGQGSSTVSSDSGTGISDGGTLSLNVGGNADPSGPSVNNEPEVTFTGTSYSQGFNAVDLLGDGDPETGEGRAIGEDEDGMRMRSSWAVSMSESKTVESLSLHIMGMNFKNNYDPDVDIYIQDNSGADQTYGEGTLVKSGWDPASAGDHTIQFDQTVSLSSGTAEVELITTHTDNDGWTDTLSLRADGDGTNSYYKKAENYDYEPDGAPYSSKKIGDFTLNAVGTTDPSITVDGSTVSHTGTLSDGQSASYELSSLDPADGSGSVSVASGTVDVTLDYTEITATEDPTIDVDGDGTAEASYTGVLRSGQSSSSLSLDGLGTGSNSISTTTVAGPAPSWTLDYTEITATEDPAVDVDGDGTDDASYTGVLRSGQESTTMAGPDLLPGSTGTASTTAGTVAIRGNYTEHTVTRDPTIELNTCSVTHPGDLAAGSSTSLSLSSNCHVSGTNQINVSVGSVTADAPTPSVGIVYGHEAATTHSVAYDASKWTEAYNVSHTYASDREGATLSIPFDSNSVVEIATVERRTNGGSWSTVGSSSRSFDGTELTVSIGGVSAGDTVEIRAEGRKVSTLNGEIEITDPTVLGDQLDTGVEVLSRSAGFGIEVGTWPRVHYAGSTSWSASDYSAISADGGQTLYLPDANAGSTFRARTSPLSIAPEGEIEAEIIDPGADPEFSLRQGSTAGSTSVDVTYLAATDGKSYRLWSITNDREVVASDASGSSVTLSTGGSAATYRIEIKPSTSTSAAAIGGGGSGGSGGSSPLSIIALFAGIGASVGGVWYLGRRFGATGRRANLVLIGTGAVVGLVGVEAVTARSVVSDLIFAFGTGFAGSGGGAVVIGIAILLAIYGLDRIVGLPMWAKITSGGLAGIYAVDSISGGQLTGALDELGPLVWLILLVGGVFLIYQSLKGPTFRIVGRPGGRE